MRWLSVLPKTTFDLISLTYANLQICHTSPQCLLDPNNFRFSLKLLSPIISRLSNYFSLFYRKWYFNQFRTNIWNKNKMGHCHGRLRITFLKVVFRLFRKTRAVAIKNSPPRSTTIYLSPTLSCPNTDEFCSLSFVRCWQ